MVIRKIILIIRKENKLTEKVKLKKLLIMMKINKFLVIIIFKLKTFINKAI